MKRHKPKFLCCKVENAVEDSGVKVLWTPSYCLDLQPMEVHWLSGKVNISRNYYFGRSVKYTFSILRDSWYGNNNCTPSRKMDLRVPEDEYPYFLIKLKKVDCFNLIKNQSSAPTIV